LAAIAAASSSIALKKVFFRFAFPVSRALSSVWRLLRVELYQYFRGSLGRAFIWVAL
jgi:hypothetical protein